MATQLGVLADMLKAASYCLSKAQYEAVMDFLIKELHHEGSMKVCMYVAS